jgi:hypothetical protein
MLLLLIQQFHFPLDFKQKKKKRQKNKKEKKKITPKKKITRQKSLSNFHNLNINIENKDKIN